jgi:alkylhydroperoxidase family enzyme
VVALQIGGRRAVRGLTDEHIAALKELGGARRDDLFDALERAVLRFATLLTGHPGSVEQHDLDERGAHLPAEEAFELVVAIVTANGTNRFNDGLGTPLG